MDIFIYLQLSSFLGSLCYYQTAPFTSDPLNAHIMLERLPTKAPQFDISATLQTLKSYK